MCDKLEVERVAAFNATSTVCTVLDTEKDKGKEYTGRSGLPALVWLAVSTVGAA